MSLELTFIIYDFQVHQYYNITNLSPKSGRAQYGNSQRDRENRKSERNRRDHQENKIDPIIGESDNSEISVYYHIIYQY